MNAKLNESKNYLANLLEAVQRCVFLLHGSESRIAWPIDAEELASRKKDIDLFEALSAVNERFAKLQDTLGKCHASCCIPVWRAERRLPARTFLL